jgi:tRNA-2-methylthio-N6-dimethylallyladenosine synthase
MNRAESNALQIQLSDLNWSPSNQPETADIIVLNTCSVRETAEQKIWGRLGKLKYLKRENSFKIVVMGCMAERFKEKLIETNPEVDIVVGNFQKDALPGILEGNTDPSPAEEEYTFADKHWMDDDFRAFLPIMHGCNNFCSYCIVPHVRGREVSRHPKEIVAEIKLQQKRGIKDITLLGQNVNSYRYEEAGQPLLDFQGLLKLILQHIDDHQWIRFLTSHPKDFTPGLVEVINSDHRMCNHIHLPVQHGSNSVLKLMNRGYTRENYLDIVETIRREIPGVSLTTDILIGFPGEDESDFEDTIALMEKVRFSDAFTYRYNPREGTKAFDLGDTVPSLVKQERLTRIIELQRKITRDEKLKKIGNTERVLIEGVSKKNSLELLGRTETDEMVIIPGSENCIGKFVTSTIQSLKGNTFFAEIQNREV